MTLWFAPRFRRASQRSSYACNARAQNASARVACARSRCSWDLSTRLLLPHVLYDRNARHGTACQNVI
eukprot:5695031-Pleurochrysis_carterae.AAC.1